jgi:hypothetical protein
MIRIKDIVAKMRRNPKGIRFRDAQKVCEFYFGEARRKSGSHCVYKTPWTGDPRINIQNNKGMAKAYQIRQILKAIDRLRVQDDVKE